jgi:hypothetical protein
MISVMLILLGATALLVVPVWRGYQKHVDSHHLDLMAGDEGED